MKAAAGPRWEANCGTALVKESHGVARLAWWLNSFGLAGLFWPGSAGLAWLGLAGSVDSLDC